MDKILDRIQVLVGLFSQVTSMDGTVNNGREIKKGYTKCLYKEILSWIV